MSKLYDYFKKQNEENKIVQAYLIGNTEYDKIQSDINKILIEFFFDNDNILNIDIQILKADEGIISKEKIKSLIDYLSRTSQFNGKKVYIIDECEKLNDFSYNAILKTLEEPQENIYAFLITKNIDSVKQTISSRCQKIFISNEEENIEDEKYLDIANELIQSIEENNLNSIYKNYNFYNKINDRNELSSILKIILKKYDSTLNELARSDLIDDNNKIEKIGKKILIINDKITMLEYNINKNLCIDRLIIEFWRCNNENSRN